MFGSITRNRSKEFWGVLFGGGAYIAGLAVMRAVLQLDDEISFSAFAGEDAVSRFDLVGWVYYSAHMVDVETTDGRSTMSSDLVSGLEYQFPELVLHAIPVLVLIAAGYEIVDPVKGHAGTAESAIKRGALITAGYFPFVVGGTVMFRATDFPHRGAEMTIPAVEAALLAGILYPVVFGGIGGYIVYHRYRGTDSRDGDMELVEEAKRGGGSRRYYGRTAELSEDDDVPDGRQARERS